MLITSYTTSIRTRALLQHQKALDIRTRVNGSEHPDVATSYNNIGNAYMKKGDLENALLQYQKAAWQEQ